MALSGFDESYYLQAKLDALQADDATAEDWAGKTTDDLKDLLEAVGYTPEEHYTAVGWSEGLAPNAYFNADEYKLFKAESLVAAGAYDTVDDALAAFEGAWTEDPYQHYLKFGAAEGVNPSNAFDETAYLEAKLAALKADDATTYADWTVADVRAAFANAGLTALEHYQLFGATEELSVDPVAAADQVNANEAKSFTLTTDTDTITGGAGNDTITGVASGLTADNTLNVGDKIDGGAGYKDTLDVTMTGAFAGFSSDGGMENVEIVNLTSDSSVVRNFDASGVSGVTEYNIDATKAAVTLSDLADFGAKISMSNQASGSASIAYASKVADGTSDVQALSFTGMGTVEDKTTTATEEKAIAFTVAGVEELDLTVSGDNVVNFTAAATKNMVIDGSGSLKMSTSPAALKTLDASAATGDLTIDLNGATAATSVQLGSGDDSLTADPSTEISQTAEVAGGDGADSLTLSGAGKNVKYTMSGVETLKLANTSALVFSAANTTDLETIAATKSMTSNATFASLGASAYTLELQGANTNTATVTVDNTDSLNIDVNTPASTATTASPSQNDIDVTATGATGIDLDVDAKMNYTGTITASAASSVTATISGKTTAAAVNAGKASDIIIDGVSNASSLNLTAGSATTLDVTAAKDLDLSGSSALSSVQILKVNSGDDFDFSKDFAKASTVTLSGAGSVELGNLGSSTLDYGVTVTASELSGTDTSGSQALQIGTITTNDQTISVDAKGVLGKVKIGNIDADAGAVNLDFNGTVGAVDLGTVNGSAISIDASGSLAANTYGSITVGSSLSFSGSDLNANVMTAAMTSAATAKTGTFTLNGGTAGDTYKVSAAAPTTTLTLTGDLDAGSDTVTIDGSTSTAGGIAIDFSGLKNYETGNVYGSTGADTIKVGVAVTNNQIYANGGSDTITLNTGKDTISYAATTASLMTLEAGTLGDTVSGFTSGTDVFAFTASPGTSTGLTTAASYTEMAAGGTYDFSAYAVIEITTVYTAGHFTAGSTDEVAKFISGAAGEATTTDYDGIFAVNDGTDSYLWYFDAADTAFASGDFTLIAKVSGVTDFTSTDFTIS